MSRAREAGPGRTVRVAVTQTKNVASLPERVEDLGRLLPADLEAIRAANVAHHVELLQAAAERGVRAIGFGELFAGPYFALHEDPVWFGLAEDAADGPTVRALAMAALQHEVVVVAPIYERTPDGRRFNTAVVIDTDGSVLGRYRKVHIPSGTNETATFSETFYYERSDGEVQESHAISARSPFFPVFRTAVGAVGVSTCYDRHFEGVIRSLADAGAELIFSPAVTFGEHSHRMWTLEFAVDAARHGVALAGSNRKGAEPPWNVEFFGASHVVTPSGRCPDLSDVPELVIADVALDALRGAGGSGWNLPRDSRPDAYS